MSDPCRFNLRSFQGDHDGPRLLITAGVHGDEFLPMLAVRHLIRRFESDDRWKASLRGTVTLIPVVNLSAYRRGERCGEDGKDLARCCPGRSDGTITDQVASALSDEISKADFYIDMHSGGKELCVLPMAGYTLHPSPEILDRQRAMAKAFQLPFLWGTSASLQGRSLSVARDASVPAIYVEYLGAHRELTEVASGALHSDDSDHVLTSGCLNVMRHLQMLDEPEENSIGQQIIEDWREGSGHMQVCNPSPASGFYKPLAQLGQQLDAGDVLAEVTSVMDGGMYHVKTQRSGKVVVIRDYPRINQGDSVAVIAENCEAK